MVVIKKEQKAVIITPFFKSYAERLVKSKGGGHKYDDKGALLSWCSGLEAHLSHGGGLTAAIAKASLLSMHGVHLFLLCFNI